LARRASAASSHRATPPATAMSTAAISSPPSTNVLATRSVTAPMNTARARFMRDVRARYLENRGGVYRGWNAHERGRRPATRPPAATHLLIPVTSTNVPISATADGTSIRNRYVTKFRSRARPTMRFVGDPISRPIDTVLAATNWLSISSLAFSIRACVATEMTIGVIVSTTMSFEVT
jgi:hypothetical protein